MHPFKDIGDGIDKIHEIHEFIDKIDDLSTDDMIHRIEAIFIREKNILEVKLSKKSFSLDVNFSVVKENIIHAVEWTELQMRGIKSVLEEIHHSAEEKYKAMIDYIKKHNHRSKL